MTDGNGNEVLVTIPKEVLSSVVEMSNARSIRIFLCVANEIVVTQHRLCEICRISSSLIDLEKGYVYLYSKGLIMRYIDNDRNVLYCLHPTYIAQHIKCGTCIESRKKLFRSKHRSAKYYKCVATLNCAYNYFRVVLTVIRQYRVMNGLDPYENTGSIRKVKIQQRVELENKAVELYTPKDFNMLCRTLHEKYYPHMPKLENREVVSAMSGLKKILIEEHPERWRLLMKNYIEYYFDRAVKENRYAMLKYITTISSILKYVNNHHSFDFGDCGEFEIYCPHWQNNGCTVKANGGLCDKLLRSKIRKAYN